MFSQGSAQCSQAQCLTHFQKETELTAWTWIFEMIWNRQLFLILEVGCGCWEGWSLAVAG